GLCHVDGNGAVEIESLPAEEAVRPHAESQDQVTPRSTPDTRLTLPGQPELGACVHARRHLHLDLLLLPQLALPLASGTGCLGDDSLALTLRARPRHREATRTEGDRPRAATLRAGDGAGARRRSTAAAGGAGLRNR